MDESFTKLFASLITSSVWQLDDKTRLVWITLLAMKDRCGDVAASLPGLANLARVSIEDCQKALDRLEAPDPYSRNPANEGRRIVPILGGWRVLNHEHYRMRRDPEARRKQNREAQARYRERKPKVSQSKPISAYTDTDTDTENKNTTYSLAQAERLAAQLEALIRGRKPDFKRRGKWHIDIDLMIRRDGRDPEAVAAVIEWCQADDFWCNNILSGRNLREHFDRMDLQRRKAHPTQESAEARIVRMREKGLL